MDEDNKTTDLVPSGAQLSLENIDLFPDEMFPQVRDVALGGWTMKDGHSVGFSSRDSQAARSLMLGVLIGLRHRGIRFNFHSLDQSFSASLAADPDGSGVANGFMGAEPGTISIVDMTAEEGEYDDGQFSFVDSLIQRRDVPVVVFERQLGMKSQAFTVDFGDSRGNSRYMDAMFFVSANRHDLVSRLVVVKCVKSRTHMHSGEFGFREIVAPNMQPLFAAPPDGKGGAR